MKTYIELWKATPAWMAMSKEERGNYVTQIGPHIQGLMEQGVQIVCWGINDSDTDHRADYDYFAVWQFPNDQMAKDFENVVEEAGWYNYFEQVNVSGKASTPDEVLGQIIAL